MSEERESLAMELLRELKLSARRWFVIALIELFIILAMATMFIWYTTIPVEEYTMEQEASEQSSNFIVGGDYNGETEGNLQETR